MTEEKENTSVGLFNLTIALFAAIVLFSANRLVAQDSIITSPPAKAKPDSSTVLESDTAISGEPALKTDPDPGKAITNGDSTLVSESGMEAASNSDTAVSDSGTTEADLLKSTVPALEDSGLLQDSGKGVAFDSGTAASDSGITDTNRLGPTVPTVSSDSTSDSGSKPDTLKKKQEKEAKKKPTRREKVFSQSRINTIDEMKGRYRSPKKALFMSLLLPGLGQAYVGHYVRAGGYFLIDVGLFAGWRHYVVVKHKRQVKKYRKFADLHWSHADYEDSIAVHFSEYQNSPQLIKEAHTTRESFCNAVFPDASAEHKTCVNFGDGSAESGMNYPEQAVYQWAQKERENAPPKEDDSKGFAEAISEYRSKTMQDLRTFYELIGKHNEYVTGWDDADSVLFEENYVSGISENRITYRKMRVKATEYSRMQTWFLGGIILNHLVSALDAAIAARLNNNKLYQTEVKWYNRVRLESFLAFDPVGIPIPTVTAHLSF